jgi:hypothetical protein
MPEDVHHLTDEQWRSLIQIAQQFRIANESRQRTTDQGDTGPRPGALAG